MIKIILLLLSLLVFSSCDEREVLVYDIPKQQKDETGYLHDYDLKWHIADDWVLRDDINSNARTYFIYNDKIKDLDSLFAIASITVLDGTAGGLIANINRWRKQLNLDPIESITINDNLKELKTNIAPAEFIELQNDKNAIYAAIIYKNEQTIFFKLSGEISLLKKHKDNFLKFISSINKIKANATES